MAKRGRPTAAATHCSVELSNTIKEMSSGKTTRTQAAEYYRAAAFSILSEAASDIPHLDSIFRIGDNGMACYQKGEIIEQLGRMLEQDGHSQEDVLHIATLAAQYYHDGYTVKQIKAWIMRVRKDWRA